MVIIGITGTLGAGKGTVVDYIVNCKGFRHYSVRGYLAEVIMSNGEEVNRDTLTHTANALRKENGPSFITDELYKKALRSGTSCIIESIRTPGEIESLRKQPGFFLLAVDAKIETRYKRIQGRNSETDNIDFDTFVQNEQREMFSDDPNKQNLSECIRQADFVICNDESLQELHKEIDKILEAIEKQ